jgi:hypothetical protein
MRSRVCSFQFCWALPFSGLSRMGLMSILYCLYFGDSPNLEGKVAVFTSPRNRVAQLYPRTLGLSNCLAVEAKLWSTVSWPNCLGVGLLFGVHDQIFFFSVWQLRVSWCGVPSLTRGQVCNLPCQSSHSWVWVPQNSWPYFTVSFQTLPTWRARSPYLYPPGTGWSSYISGYWVPFMSPLTTHRATVEVF